MRIRQAVKNIRNYGERWRKEIFFSPDHPLICIYMNDLGTISLNTCNSRAQTDLSAMLSDAGHQRFSETAKPAFEVCQLLSTLVITSATPQNQFLPHPDRIDSFGEHGKLGIDQWLPDHSIHGFAAQWLKPLPDTQVFYRFPILDSPDLKYKQPQPNPIHKGKRFKSQQIKRCRQFP